MKPVTVVKSEIKYRDKKCNTELDKSDDSVGADFQL